MGTRFDVSVKRAAGDGDVETERHRFDGIVVCAGVASRNIAAMLGDRVNIYPVKGYSITVGLDDEASQQAAPWVSLLDDSAKIVTSRLGANRFRVAGTAEINGFNRDIRADRIAPLVDWTRRHFRGIDTSKVIPWSGLRPMMPGMMPKVSKGSRQACTTTPGMGIWDGRFRQRRRSWWSGRLRLSGRWRGLLCDATPFVARPDNAIHGRRAFRGTPRAEASAHRLR